jgi:DNA-binding GntR family transcriptional regulator
VVKAAVAALKAGLRRGDYAPGQRLVVVELARDLGLSRRPLAASDAVAASGNLRAFIDANHAFHAAIHAAGRRRLTDSAEALSLPLDRLTTRRPAAPEVMRARAAEHRDIAAAILCADKDRRATRARRARREPGAKKRPPTRWGSGLSQTGRLHVWETKGFRARPE